MGKELNGFVPAGEVAGVGWGQVCAASVTTAAEPMLKLFLLFTHFPKRENPLWISFP